ncbi:MAG TPA: entericidin EcnAB [Verrucomicrobiales bacterium]|nr:entericidin EcnAB [Verrucomicrobiales bacterium]
MKTSSIRFALLLLASAGWSVIATSCNTFHGFGRDVKATGQTIERVARR